MNKWCGPPHEQPYLCGAHARSAGRPCRQLAMQNGRCYLHGGKSTGAKKPRVKHGLYTKEALAERQKLNRFIKETKRSLKELLK